jgi:Ca-activated chloride channel homolog
MVSLRLCGGTYTGSVSFEDVLEQADGALGRDPDGYRSEFLELVRKAELIRK